MCDFSHDPCVIGSDFGQVLHMDTIDGMRVFLRALLAFGIRKADVKTMLVDNPAKLIWLD
jgi:predicted metal-dependent phosphotriesterase family hydrolase